MLENKNDLGGVYNINSHIVTLHLNRIFLQNSYFHFSVFRGSVEPNLGKLLQTEMWSYR
jgi:hypothetical protein